MIRGATVLPSNARSPLSCFIVDDMASFFTAAYGRYDYRVL